jgi:hypothetical protein
LAVPDAENQEKLLVRARLDRNSTQYHHCGQQWARAACQGTSTQEQRCASLQAVSGDNHAFAQFVFKLCVHVERHAIHSDVMAA